MEVVSYYGVPSISNATTGADPPAEHVPHATPLSSNSHPFMTLFTELSTSKIFIREGSKVELMNKREMWDGGAHYKLRCRDSF